MVPDAQPRYAGYLAWRGTVDIDQLSGRSASILLDAYTYRILPRGHLLAYPIPGPSGSVLFNWLWYQNIAAGDRLTDLLTDRNGVRAELAVPAGSVQTRHVEQLHSSAADLPAPLAEVIQRTAEPFIQVIVDLEVPRMAFGRSCLIGDAAFALRPHIGVGTAKAADDAWQLGTALQGTTAPYIPDRLKGVGDSTAVGGAACPAEGSHGGSKLAGRHLAGRRSAPVRAAGAGRQRAAGRPITVRAAAGR